MGVGGCGWVYALNEAAVCAEACDATRGAVFWCGGAGLNEAVVCVEGCDATRGAGFCLLKSACCCMS